MWVYVHLGPVSGARSSQATPRQLGWEKTHSSPIRGWGSVVHASAQFLGLASQQLVPQLEHTKVPEQQNHSCN